MNGYNILILNGSDRIDKHEFEQKAISLGAKIVQSSPPEFDSKFLAVAGKDCGIRVKNLKMIGSIDILKGEWLMECFTNSSFIPFKTR